MTAAPRAALRLPKRAGASGWGLWQRKHGGVKGVAARQGTGRGGGVPPVPPIGARAVAPGTCPGCLARGPFPGPGGDPCVSSAGEGGGSPQPRAGFIAARGHGGSRLSAAGGPPGTAGGFGGGWRREQRTRGRTEQRGRTLAHGHRCENGGVKGEGGEGATGPRHGRASGGGGTAGMGRGGGDGAGGGPCPARAFVHGRRSAAPAPPGAEVLQSN